MLRRRRKWLPAAKRLKLATISIRTMDQFIAEGPIDLDFEPLSPVLLLPPRT